MAPTSKMLTASASITLIYGSLDNTATHGAQVSWMVWVEVCSRFSTNKRNVGLRRSFFFFYRNIFCKTRSICR